jgi:hypothetical protein
MDDFYLYLTVGFEHITDPGGYDHILFILTLFAGRSFQQWKELLWLITAFTVGHSLTLALAVLGWMNINRQLIETLIPITIIISGSWHFLVPASTTVVNANNNLKYRFWARLQYAMALFFGLIHGLGFSNYLRALLGKDPQAFLIPLFAFNCGLEIGQLLIGLLILVLNLTAVSILRFNHFRWQLLLSGIAIGMAISILIK